MIDWEFPAWWARSMSTSIAVFFEYFIKEKWTKVLEGNKPELLELGVKQVYH